MRFLNLLFFVLFLLTGLSGRAQNLVPDPGFESYKKLPYDFCYTADQYTNSVENWFVPTLATPDYFHARCRGNSSTVKNNFAGNQKAQEGQAYSGFYACLKPGDNYREYLEVRLLSKLKAGKQYKIEFYVSLAESSEYATNRLGVILLKKKYSQQNMGVISHGNQAESPDSIFYESKKNWMLVRMFYTASGGERYLIIGNFRSGNEMKLKKVAVNKKHYFKDNGSYYYIDNVSLSAQNDSAKLPQVYTGEERIIQKFPADTFPQLKQSRSFVFQSVYFDTDRSELKPESFSSLDSLVLFLKANPAYSIRISGHTDNSGNEQKNILLSAERAKSVAVYLVQQGIPEERVAYEGLGSSRPIATNENAEGKKKNRRVQYILVN